jgi:hypothetical protein
MPFQNSFLNFYRLFSILYALVLLLSNRIQTGEMKKSQSSISVDYLSVSLGVPLSYSGFNVAWLKSRYSTDFTPYLYVNDSLYLLPIPSPSIAYKGCFKVILHGEKVGTFFCDGIQRGLLSFQFDNSLFYQSDFNPQSILDSFCDAFDTANGIRLCTLGITRLDLACDSNFDSLSFYAQKVHGTASNSFFSSKASKTIKAKFKNLSNAKVSQVGNSLYFGSIKSGSKSVCIYPKEDLHPYQSSYIASSGVDTSKPVYRIECRLVNGSTKVSQYVPSLDMLCDPEFLISLFLKQSRRILTLVNIRTGKDFNALRSLALVSSAVIPKVLARIVPRQSNENKRFLKHLMREYLNNVGNNLFDIERFVAVRPLHPLGFDPVANKEISIEVLNSLLPECLDLSLYNNLFSILNGRLDWSSEVPIDPSSESLNLIPLESYKRSISDIPLKGHQYKLALFDARKSEKLDFEIGWNR